ncbi:MAG: hypothetical protein A2902_05320 [Elusimicrobia bacterium RIFCSPLOWO2_01_FULL_64_13]|nr:MAG: hypothetical protein A2636_03625 [Elusimicrobia bacterium RIFCSPHIGHO2_01_FULL_64_10]OGR95347.1 MAG: hypothetical protein A2902_05320 [Elusimicrobia bacterium RIFCSPLOWO2_01_FULL_64_13]
MWKVSELAGSRVETTDGMFLGLLTDVIPTGANDVFVVRDEDREVLIPALKTVVVEVSIQDKKIVVKPPPGLLEIYAGPPGSGNPR